MCGQVHRLHSLLPPATDYSVRRRPVGHPFDLPGYNNDLSRKSFVLRRLYELNSIFCALFVFYCVPFLFILLIFSFCFFLHVRLLRAFNEERVYNSVSTEMCRFSIELLHSFPN